MNKGKDKKKEYITPNEAAEILLVSPITIRQLAQKGELPARVTPGGHRRFLMQDIENYALSKGIHIDGLDERKDMLKVLVVDDDQQICYMLSETIAAMIDGSIVDTASDGFEAGQKVIQLKPDIVLLDIMMPGINGVDVCKRIRQNEDIKNTKIIAMTGYYSKENISSMLNAGADACIEKPINIDLLLDELAAHKESIIKKASV